jgi:hypothetical protein
VVDAGPADAPLDAGVRGGLEDIQVGAVPGNRDVVNTGTLPAISFKVA